MYRNAPATKSQGTMHAIKRLTGDLSCRRKSSAFRLQMSSAKATNITSPLCDSCCAFEHMKESSVFMSRRKFCTGAAAVAAQMVFESLGDNLKRQKQEDWKFPLHDLLSCSDDDIDVDYGKEDYLRDVHEIGIEKTWRRICKWVLTNGEGKNTLLTISNFGELYEEGLAARDKHDKKSSGQYYTPLDVSRVMAKWYSRLDGRLICDVACGVGNLILVYLDMVGENEARKILGDGRLYLYDMDEIALVICVTSIITKYGKKYIDRIHVVCGDFLAANNVLPNNCKVISNPPYAVVDEIPECWEYNDVERSTKELYAAFMAKIMKQSVASVIITPYSFIGGSKFLPLRRMMNNYNGFVVSFDNVPGTIFNGRKHGIFNTNRGNSVRAAITVVENDSRVKGFRFSPLIRFKGVERSRLLSCRRLEELVGGRRQLVTPTQTMFAKCDRRMEHIFEAWNSKSTSVLSDYVEDHGRFVINMPNTCRYYTVAIDHSLSRKGQLTIRFADEDVYWYVMSMVNSSFAYWFWRLYDGGITYLLGLVLKMPLFYDSLSVEDKMFFRDVGREMVDKANDFIVTKTNVGIQENIKFPRMYRDRLNRRLLDVIGVADNEKIFDIVHSNMALEVNV